MARFFPPTLDGESPTPGEERVFVHLRRVLPDDTHWGWYQPTLPTPRGRQPDFVFLGPRYGLMVLEVKDWDRGAIVRGTRTWMEVRVGGEVVRRSHPEKQARELSYIIREQFEQTPSLCHAAGPHAGRPVLPINWGTVWPNMSRTEVVELEERGVPIHSARALTREELEHEGEEGTRRLLRALARLCEVSFRFELDERIRERVRAVIEPQLHVFDLREPGPVAEAPAPPPPDQETGEPLEEPAMVTRAPLPRLPGFFLDRKQARMARGLASPRTLVYGPAGSGKTVFLVARARYWLDRKPEARVLFTCYNASLASHLRHVFALEGLPPDGKRLTVRHYHDLCSHQLGITDIHERSPEFYAALEPKVLKELSRGDDVPAFDLILIDEGQDFTRRMLDVLVRLSAEGGELTLVCDPAQDIYGRWTPDNLSPLGRYETEHLVDCYRNTAPIFALALGVLEPGVRVAMGLDRLEMTRPEDLDREGPPPVLQELDGLDDLISLIANTCEEFDRKGRALSELAVLYPDRHAIPNFSRRVRYSHWRAARDPLYAVVPEEDRPEIQVTRGTLHPQSDRDDLPLSDRPHFAKALEQELRARGIPADWVARDFASKAAYDISRPRLTLSTVHSAKGMDFHTVILLGSETLSVRPGADGRRARSLLFTGITRAREMLILPYLLDRGWIPGLRERLASLESGATI